jgi:hypothetical protein
MRYTEFRDSIQAELQRTPAGLCWKDLKQRLQLPYERPCSTWIRRLESDIGLARARKGSMYLWMISAGSADTTAQQYRLARNKHLQSSSARQRSGIRY